MRQRKNQREERPMRNMFLFGSLGVSEKGIRSSGHGEKGRE